MSQMMRGARSRLFGEENLCLRTKSSQTKRRFEEKPTVFRLLLLALIVLAAGSPSPGDDDRDASKYLPITSPGRLASNRNQANSIDNKCASNNGNHNTSLGHYFLNFNRRFTWPTFGSVFVQVEAIRLLRIDAPASPVQAGQAIRLRCLYETTRGDKLQSLSWYKNGREFYRYQPFERRQPVLAFNLTGVYVDLTKSKNSTVILFNTTSETSGRYKCEATGTSFQEVILETYVNVIAASSSGTASLIVNSLFYLIVLILIPLLTRAELNFT